jgi:hypothetical protein
LVLLAYLCWSQGEKRLHEIRYAAKRAETSDLTCSRVWPVITEGVSTEMSKMIWTILAVIGVIAVVMWIF